MSPSPWRIVRRQLPFFIWLVALWMLLWGQFTPLAFVTGVVVAVVVTRTFRLPPVELSGRVNPWHLTVYIVAFLASLVASSLTVAWQVFSPRPPGAAVVAVPMRVRDDLIMTHVAVTASLIPGSLVLDADRDRRILYLHVIGVHSEADAEDHRQSVLRWETRIVRAIGSRNQLAQVRADRAVDQGRAHAGGRR